MKFGQLITYHKRNVFIQESCRKSGSETYSRYLFVFYEIKANRLHVLVAIQPGIQ